MPSNSNVNTNTAGSPYGKSNVKIWRLGCSTLREICGLYQAGGMGGCIFSGIRRKRRFGFGGGLKVRPDHFSARKFNPPRGMTPYAARARPPASPPPRCISNDPPVPAPQLRSMRPVQKTYTGSGSPPSLRHRHCT